MTKGLCGTLQVSCKLKSFRKIVINPGLDSSEENQWRGNMPHSKNVAKTLTNLRHFGTGGRSVRKKKDNCSKLLTHIVLI